MAATIDEAASGALGRTADVSVLHLWSRYAITRMSDAIRENKNRALAEEPNWPYSADAANAFYHANQCKSGKLSGKACSVEPDFSHQREADLHPYVTLLGVSHVDSSSVEALERKLAGGQDIWFCAKIGGHLSCGKKGCNLEKLPDSDDFYVRDAPRQSHRSMRRPLSRRERPQRRRVWTGIVVP